MKRMLLSILFVMLSMGAIVHAQTPAQSGGEVVDRMIAVVNGDELITYSDLLWQLALQPGAPLDSPRHEDLQAALDLLIDQRLVLQEAEKLPHVHATDKEIDDALADLIKHFPSLEEFHRRLDRTGLTAAQLRDIIHERLDMTKYLDFRFRSFTVVTPQEVEAYYREDYVPRRKRQSPGTIVPELKSVYNELQAKLIEAKVSKDTYDYLEEARTAAKTVYLDESFGDGGQRSGTGGQRPANTAPQPRPVERKSPEH
jgi:parvulin-like peptidyl-prolyl isomerase